MKQRKKEQFEKYLDRVANQGEALIKAQQLDKQLKRQYQQRKPLFTKTDYSGSEQLRL